MNNQEMYVLFTIIGTIIVFLIISLVIFTLARAIKKFIFELIDRANGTAPRTGAGKTKYTYTYNAQQKRNQDEKPPWEE